MERGRKKWRGVGDEANKVINFKLQRDKRILPSLYCQRNGVLLMPLKAKAGVAS